MSEDPRDSTRFSLRRWSQRKLEATRRGEPTHRQDAARADDAARREQATRSPALPSRGAAHGDDANARNDDRGVRHTGSSVDTNGARTERGGGASAAGPDSSSTGVRESISARGVGPSVPAPSASVDPALPPVESLTIDSDFSPFLRPGVEEDVKRTALRKLFRDPRFNVMDGLDVYIDDYSKPSPIEPELVRQLMQARYIFDPPKTHVNTEGFVEDVPEEPETTAPAAAPVAAPASVDRPMLPDAGDAAATPATGDIETTPAPGDAAATPATGDTATLTIASAASASATAPGAGTPAAELAPAHPAISASADDERAAESRASPLLRESTNR